MEIPTGERDRSATESREQSGHEQKQEDNVTVVFVTVGGDEIETRVCALSDSVHSFKQHFFSLRGDPFNIIDISYQGESLSNSTTIEELGAEPGQSLSLVVQLTPAPPSEGGAPANQAEEAPPPTAVVDGYRMPDAFTVQVPTGEGDQTREILIKVERSLLKKPFLGGYRHRVSGVEYHHASAQTMPKRRPDNGIVKLERNTQTVKTRNQRQQVTVDAATQMNKTGCFINSRHDRVVPATGDYERADDYHERILKKVIVLQTYWRRWLAQQYVAGLRRDKLAREEWERQERERKEREREMRAKRELSRRMNPRTKEDFELLYHALEMWRQDELGVINETMTGAERKAALCSLLEQEAQLIASIGQHKNAAARDNKQKNTKRFLDATAAPKQWIAYDGKVTKMDTPFTLRAQQLRDLYNSVTLEGLSKDERLDVLLTLKCTVKEHDCSLTREIVELVDREADLLVRGMKDETLKGLRKRIATLFFQYCKTPLFNAEAAKHIKVPQDTAKIMGNTYYCRSCCQYLPSTDFELSTNSRVVGHCRQCRELDNQARAREDFTLYRAMLRNIRKSEERFQDKSHIVFLLQEPDLRYLVENIWGGQSSLSAVRDVFELTLSRWEKKEHWSPWNCILLTKDEAKAHSKLEDIEQAYGSQLVRKVRYRHVLARSYFSRIPDMAEQMKGKVQELPLPRPKEREIMARVRTDTHQQNSLDQQQQQIVAA